MESPELEVAERAARAAGEVVARYYRDGIAMRNKDVSNLVSDADVEAERAVVDVIRRTYPGHEILAEETHPGDAGADHIWVVDPLGNLMMRFPSNADPNRTKRDLAKLLRASRIG